MAKSYPRAVVLAVLLILLALGSTAMGAIAKPDRLAGGWQPGPAEYHPSRVMVRFSDVMTASAAEESIIRLGYTIERRVEFEPTSQFPSGLRLGIVNIPANASVDSAISALRTAPGILYAERDYKQYKAQMQADAPVIPNDTHFDKMWGLHNLNCQYKDPRMQGDPVDDADIDAPEAWGTFTGSDQTLVSVIDTGSYIFHPDLFPHVWTNPGEIPNNGVDDDGNGYVDDVYGWDWFNGDNTVWDPNERDSYGYLNDEHGTHTSGTIAAASNNAMGVAGINWNVKVMILKFLGPDGGYTSDAILALNYAANKNAKVISCSWGGGGYQQALKDAIEATHAIVACAAGNSGQNTDVNPHYPSSYDSANIISVAASMQNDSPCNYSGWWSTCWGPNSVDLFAPGGYILSTIPPDPPPSQPAEAYAYFYGTSMATPHVSGAAALVHSFRPNIPLYPGAPGWTPGESTIKDIILGSVDVKPAFQGKVLTGGRLNIANALAAMGGPAITSIDAQPRFGPPPLEVTFTATATCTDGEIVDKWWDFGDGSEAVHEFNTVHTYTEQDDFTATFHAVDGEGLEATASVTIKVFFPPEIEVDPTEVHTTLWWGEIDERPVTITNEGLGDLNYTANVRLIGMVDASGVGKLGSGGPDSYGYLWMDSDEPGMPAPYWEDIRPVGTMVTLGDDNGVSIDLPFEFPFYGQKKTSINICSNGYLTFGSSTSSWSNSTIPNSAAPNDLIAPFWDDLTLSSTGSCHYYGDADEFVVQYTDVPRLSSGGPYTFQVTLLPTGVIIFNYHTMLGTRLNEATVGVENATGTVGLQVAYNEPYAHNDLITMFMPGWLTLNKTHGTVLPGDSDELMLAFFASRLPKGTWKAVVEIHSNDPANPRVNVDTFMFVKSIIPPTITSALAQPWAGSAPLEVHFQASASDPDGQVVGVTWDFGDGSSTVSGDFNPVHIYAAEGNYTATVTVVDDDGFETSADVQIIVADLPEVEVDPTAFNQAIRAHRQRTEKLTVTNTGVAPLQFTATAYTTGVPSEGGELDPMGGGGPDGFGYVWRDSDEPGGPTFNWAEISTIGTKLTTLTDDQTTTVSLPWAFPFYGESYTSVNVNANGWLNVGTTSSGWSNYPIPTSSTPNNLLAVYWDDLRISANPSAGVYYYHDTVHDRFIVQFNKVPRYSNNGQYTFEAILYPNGTIEYQYLDMQFSGSYGSRGTIGIENATGTDGLQVLYNTAGYMKNGLAIRFKPISWLAVIPTDGMLMPGESMDLDVTFDMGLIPSGTLDGAVVLDTNDIRKPRTIVPVHVQVIPNNPPIITACGVNPASGAPGSSFQFVGAAYDSDGSIVDKWWDFGDGSAAVHQFVTDHVYADAGVYTATLHAADNDGYKATATIKVTVGDPASASWNPSQFQFRVGGGQSTTGTLTLANAGPGTLVFGSGEFPNMARTLQRLVEPLDIRDPEAKTAEGIHAPNQDPTRSEWLPDAVGSVVKSWRCPSPIGLGWGVGVLLDSDEVVIGDGAVDPTVDYVITADGAYTGKNWSANFGGSWSGDMAFDGTYMWQVNIGGDNGIYKIDPTNGAVLGSIKGSPWSSTSQRGLAYNANDDTFYIGGWNEDIIYKIMGETWSTPGQVIEEWSMPVGIAGLAYHPVADILAVTVNASPDMIYFVDPVSHAILGQFAHPYNGDYAGAGCEFGADGNLWVASQDNNTMYLVETGLGPVGAGGWLSWSPDEGNVPAGGSMPIVITADAEELNPGTYTGNVVLTTNDIENPLIVVPVTLSVAAGPSITEATATPTSGEPPLTVTFHAAFTAPEVPVVSAIWDFGDGSGSSELDVAHTYTAPGSFTATFTVVDELGATAIASFDIVVKWTPHATVDPTLIEVTLPPNGTATDTVTVGNISGNAPLNFSVKVKGGSAPVVAMPKRIGSIVDPNAATAEGLYMPFDPSIVEKIARNVRPDGVGSVVTSWPAPASIDIAWGLGFDTTNVWLGDPLAKKDYLITPEGVFTGTVFDTPWAASWSADMAYDANRNLIWQVNVGGDNGIYGLNPATGAVVTSITSGGAWTGTSQRGLAYDADTDTFFIAGWNEDTIYHIMGPSWGTPGAIIEAYDFPVSIAGLEWHPNGILWVSTNSAPDMIYGLDLAALAVVYQFPHPYGGDYSGAGLALHSDGNLWASSQENNRVYLVDTEMPLSAGISVNPASGTVPQGLTADLTVTINAAELGKPGQDVHKYLEITTNDPLNPALFVDLIVHIEAGPTITAATATPEIGQPPLTVTFDATVEQGAKPITDMWWDFGDGTDPVHEAHTEHVYPDLGVYEAVFHVVDENAVEVTAKVTVTVKWLPVLEVNPQSFNFVIPVGTEAQDAMTISNPGHAPLNFNVAVTPSFAGSPEWEAYVASEPVKGDCESEPVGFAGAGAGGPDLFGYVWADSKQPGGPSFDWVEVSDLGTRVFLGDDDAFTVSLPFAFPFYGTAKTQIAISANGYLTFDPGSADGYWTNAPIPTSTKPNDLLAAFWDDLNPGNGGEVYYYHDAENARFIVEYKNVPRLSGSTSLTFQVILKPDGTILYQYLNMAGTLASATVGIEDAAGSDGLQVVYNAAYIENDLAIGFSPVGSVLKVNPSSGYLVVGGEQDVVLTVGSPQAAPATYSLYLYVTGNDPYRPVVAVPVTIKLNQRPEVTITDPVGGSELHGVTEVKWTANDPDDDPASLLIDLDWTRDGTEWHELGHGMANSGVFEWNTIEVGAGGNTFRVRARATDPANETGEFVTDEFTIINLAPVAAFSFTPSPATRSDVVEFTDESTDDGRIVAWHWEFGDGSESNGRNPEHQYTSKGTFTIKLTVTDNGGLEGIAENTIVVVNAAPIAAFSLSPTVANAGEVITFTNESIDDTPLTTCFWNFGDGTTSGEWDAQHVYNAAGIFTVKLTVIDEENAANSVEHSVEIINAPPEVTVLRPEAGDVWAGTKAIEWEATDPDDDADTLRITIQFQQVGDVNWKTVAVDQPNTGSYPWDTSVVGKGGRYRIRVTATDPSNASTTVTSADFTIVVLAHTVVAAPNPAKDEVTFFYDIEANGTLYVYDMSGRLVYKAELLAEANMHEWNLTSGGRPVANGVYIYLIASGSAKSETGRLVVNR